jgi:hypothetical protein
MLEDLLELRRILDKFIAKYQAQDEYRFEHDTRLAEDLKKLDTYEIEGDDRLTDIGMELLKLKQKENNERSREKEAPYKWEGNDIY